jgi:hypothetical protein
LTGACLSVLDEGDIAAALDAGPADFRDVFDLGIQPQVFFEIVLRDEISPPIAAMTPR